MKNIYILMLIVCFTNLSFGQDTLMTELVFKTSGSNSLKVYKLVKEKYIYYGSSHTDFDSDDLSHTHYPKTGISYEREYLLTAPGRIFIPNNKEVSYVVLDNKEKVSTRFTTTTDGRRQVWNLVPAGKNYKTGQRTFTMGVVGYWHRVFYLLLLFLRIISIKLIWKATGWMSIFITEQELILQVQQIPYLPV